MSLDKAIKYKKEKRKAYTGAKAVSWHCCNHGSCEYCYDNRTKKNREKEKIAREEIREISNSEMIVLSNE